VAKTHKRRDRKSSGRRLGQNRKNALNLLQTVRIGLLRFWSLRVHRRIARGVFPLKVILLLRQGENSADDALNVLECVPAEFAPSDLIEPRLNVIGSSVLQPDPLTQGVEVVFPDVLLSLRSRGPLVLHYPRQIIGEAKWLSSVGSAQGVNRDKDQIILRREFCEKYGRRLLPSCRHFVILGVSPKGGIAPNITTETEGVQIWSRDTTWEAISRLDSHPVADKVQAYLAWKSKNSRKMM